MTGQRIANALLAEISAGVVRSAQWEEQQELPFDDDDGDDE